MAYDAISPLGSDQYMLAALKSANFNNPAFRAANIDTSTQIPDAVQTPVVQTQLTKKDSSNASKWILGIGALAYVAGAVKGKSFNPVKGWKEIYNRIANNAVKEMTEFSVKTKTGDEIIIKNGQISQIFKKGEETALDSAAQKEFLDNNSDILAKINKLIQRGKANGVTRQYCLYTDANGNRYAMNANGELFGIQPKGQRNGFKIGSDEYNQFLENNKDAVAIIQKEYESGLAPNNKYTQFIIN